MLTSLSRTELAFRDTLISRAPGGTQSAPDALDWLSRFYQLSRPAAIQPEFWRQALRAVLYGARGTRGNMHAFLERATGQWAETFQVTTDPAAPGTLTWVSGGSFGGFKAQHVNRLVRIGDMLYRSMGPSFVAMGAVQGFVTLCPLTTAYWAGARFTAVAQVAATFLPFVWCDTDAQFYFWGDFGDSVPPTYLQPSVMWANSEAGGIVGADPFMTGSDVADIPEWKQVAGWFGNKYTVTAQTAGTWRNLVVNADNGTVPARGGDHILTLGKVVAGVFIPTSLTCTLGAAAVEVKDLAHSEVLAEGDVVMLKVSPQAGVTEPLIFPRACVYIDPPSGEPKGGYVLNTAWVQGDQVAGPWPLYIGTALDAELIALVNKLLAAGIILRQWRSDFTAFAGLPG